MVQASRGRGVPGMPGMPSMPGAARSRKAQRAKKKTSGNKKGRSGNPAKRARQAAEAAAQENLSSQQKRGSAFGAGAEQQNKEIDQASMEELQRFLR